MDTLNNHSMDHMPTRKPPVLPNPSEGRSVKHGEEREERAHALNRLCERLMERSWLALLLIGAILIALGLLQNDPVAVFTKAATVCLECIGIG